MAPRSPFVQKLVALATKEFNDFHELDEHDEQLRSRINDYCDAAGVPHPGDIDEFPWSAVFISWCIKTAGATEGEFDFSDTHAVFVKAAIANADAGVGVFRARPIDSYKPKVGDLIHRNREGGRITYAQARSRSDYPSHSAIVVDLVATASGKFAVTIGGNESNSIRRKRVRLTSTGFVKQTAADPYVCVIEDLKEEVIVHENRPEQVYAATANEQLVCEASGDGESMDLEAAPVKPPARQETTTHKDSRQGTSIDYIVVHYTTSRNINGTISHFKTGTPRTSAHYIVGLDGLLVQMVPDSDNAWHAGKPAMNRRSIGIEHVGALGDRITAPQSATSIALIRYLMHAYGIPAENVIPHVCVKPTSCCGDLFRDFGGGAGFSCAKQQTAVRAWLASNGIYGQVEAGGLTPPGAAYAVADFEPEATAARTIAMAKAIVNFEARRDGQGRIAIYRLPPGDGGGRYEVAGINERYHKAVCDELVALIQNGRHAEAEVRAAEFIASFTNKAASWTSNPGIEFYVRDCMFNRGAGGAAWILQKAVGVPIDQQVGRQTLAAVQAAEARPRELLDRLRAARESYERLRRNESSPFWPGLVNRWNKARQIAITFMPQPHGDAAAGAELEMQSAMSADNEIRFGLSEIPFIDNEPANTPSFYDIGNRSAVDDPARMLKGIRAFRNNIDPGVSLEVVIDRDTSLPASFLEVLATGRRAVGKISTSGNNYRGIAGAWSGTGFLVGKNILLTNHHVLNSADVAGRAVVDFTYEVPVPDLAGGLAEPKAPSARRYRLNPERLFITSPVGSGGLDYTFVWIEDEAESSFGSIVMARAAFSVSERERAFIIHHPEGRGRRVSLDENDVLRITTSVVRYSTDTMPGSSGSPVFNRQGRLIALHHASAPDPVQMPNGRKTNVLNEGIKIAAIVADLETRNSGLEGPMARRVLDVVQGSDTMAGFFGSLGRTADISGDSTSVERVVDVYTGTDNDIDIGFWNIEWLANRYHDPEKLRLAAFLIVDLGLDIWGLEEVSPPAVRALVKELQDRFGEHYEYALSEPDAGEGKQSTAVIWKAKTVTGRREEWPDEIERLWHLRSTDDLGLEAVEGKIFDRYPGLFRFSVKTGYGASFEFHVVPVHLKAMDEGSKRRKLASRLLAHAVKIMIEKHDASDDWVLGGDFNAELASNDFADLLQGDFVPLSAADEDAGQMSFIKSPKSLIDHIFVSPNLARRTGDDSYFIVAKEKSVDGYREKLSDHRPVLVRLRLTKSTGSELADGPGIDAEIARLLGGDPVRQMPRHKHASRGR